MGGLDCDRRANLRDEIQGLLLEFGGDRSVKRLFWELLGYDRRDEIVLISQTSIFRSFVIDSRLLASHESFHVYHVTLTGDVFTRRTIRQLCYYFRLKHRHIALLVSDVSQTRWQLAYLAAAPASRRFRMFLGVMSLGGPDDNPRRQASQLEQLKTYDADDAPVARLELVAAFESVFLAQEARFARPRGGGDGVALLFEDMNRFPLLTARQERSLLIELDQVSHQEVIQEGKKAKTIRVPIAGRESRFRELRDQLILHNLRLCFYVAKRYAINREELLDLFQESVIGLSRATDLVDSRRGLRFTTYAYWWIRQAVLRWIRQRRLLIRIPDHVYGLPKSERPRPRVTPLDEAIEDGMVEFADPSARSPFSVEGNLEMNAIVGRSLRRLPDRDSYVLTRRFGLCGASESTLSEIGESLGLTRERVRQIEAKALEKLRGILEPFRESLN